MDSLPEKTEITCLKCGEPFGVWYRSANEAAIASACPHCGHDLARDPKLREEGGAVVESDDGEDTRRTL